MLQRLYLLRYLLVQIKAPCLQTCHHLNARRQETAQMTIHTNTCVTLGGLVLFEENKNPKGNLVTKDDSLCQLFKVELGCQHLLLRYLCSSDVL